MAFDHNCREGICGACSLTIDGIAHGPQARTAVCQLLMRHFRDGDEIDIEPFRAGSFPIITDLVVDRSAFDRIVEAGGYISAPTGAAPDAHATPVREGDADRASDSAACISCGACVAACPNGSAMLFTGAKATHLGSLPQGQPERSARAVSLIEAHDAEGFGGCSQIGECAAVCPAGIPLDTISRLNGDVLGTTGDVIGSRTPRDD